MKGLIFFAFFIPLMTAAQRNKEEKTESYNSSYGYVNGVRIDTISAKYVQIGLTAGANIAGGVAGTLVIRRYTFDYGQPWKTEKEIRLTNIDGIPLTFQSFAEVMNFMDFNGWELVFFVPEHHQALLKKKQL